MPTYTLHYFNQRGRAEICRMLFAMAGVQYTDKRMDKLEWVKVKTKMPCFMIPLLEIDNKSRIPQSMSIARYLAREFGFHGKTSIEMARVDYICDSFYDIMDDYLRIYQDGDGRMVFERLRGTANTSEKYLRFKETCSRILPYMERTLEMFNGGNQYYMGDQMTIADMMCYCALENPMIEDTSLLNNYPKIQSLRNRVMNIPRMSMYLKKRYRTEF